MFLLTEPDAIKKNKSKDFDASVGGALKAIPEGFTIYDKITVKVGSLTC
jgi:hypothetical protein